MTKIFILIIVIVLILIIFWIISRSTEIKTGDISLSELAKIADNGDLIFLSGSTVSEKFCKKLINSPFSHVGFLFRELHPETGENILYIWDSDIGQKCKEGTRVMPLKQKLIQYKGQKVGGFKQLNGKRPELKDILDIIPLHLSKNFDSKFLWSWITSYSPHQNSNKKNVFCSELIASTLQNLGIMKDIYPAASYHPGDFLEEKNLYLQDGYSYGKMSIFSFDHKIQK
ncbi:hypothetical protein OAG24_00105 [bacterium]|nr:hypothetical protein [bacterium]